MKLISPTSFVVCIVCGIALLYYYLAPKGHTPTCIQLKFSLPKNDLQNIDNSFQAYIEISNLLQTEQSKPFKRRGFNDHVFVKWDSVPEEANRELSRLFICKQHNGDGAYWQNTTKEVERIFLPYHQTGAAKLQRGEEYVCNRDCMYEGCKNACSLEVEFPIDFNRLKQRGLIN